MATVTGGSGRDTLGYGRATEGDDGIWGLGGAGLINGLGDNDYIRGGEGADAIIGGAGIIRQPTTIPPAESWSA